MKCYVCGKELAKGELKKDQVQTHGEHIIPNALVGHLISNKILCKDCGGSLSGEDAKFTDIFKAFVMLLKQGGKLSTLDHGKNSNRTTEGEIYTDSDTIKITLNNEGKIIPSKPEFKIHEGSNVIDIIANKKIISDYKKLAENEAKKMVDVSKYTFNEVTNLFDKGPLGLYFSKDRPNFNSSITEGLAKMVVEFALHNDIDRNQLKGILNINEKTGESQYNYNNLKVRTFIPNNIFDLIYESDREKYDSNFPSHVLKLYTENYTDGSKKLLAYVELFSTFQYYVLLNDQYKGRDINISFAQRLLKQENPYTINDLNCMRPKELLEVITFNNLDKSLTKLDMDELPKKIFDQLEQRPLVFNYEENLTKAYRNILEIINGYLLNKISGSNTSQFNLDDSIKKTLDTLFYRDKYFVSKLGNLCETLCQDGIQRFVNAKINQEENITYESYSEASAKVLKENKEFLISYTKMKHTLLSGYCFNAAGLQMKD